MVPERDITVLNPLVDLCSSVPFVRTVRRLRVKGVTSCCYEKLGNDIAATDEVCIGQQARQSQLLFFCTSRSHGQSSADKLGNDLSLDAFNFENAIVCCQQDLQMRRQAQVKLVRSRATLHERVWKRSATILTRGARNISGCLLRFRCTTPRWAVALASTTAIPFDCYQEEVHPPASLAFIFTFSQVT